MALSARNVHVCPDHADHPLAPSSPSKHVLTFLCPLCTAERVCPSVEAGEQRIQAVVDV